MGLPKHVQEELAQAEADFAAVYPDRITKADETEVDQLQGDSTPGMNADSKAQQVADATKGNTQQVAPVNTDTQQDFEHKYNVLKGKYNSEVPKLQTQLNTYRDEVGRLQEEAKATPQTPAEDVSNLNTDEKLSHLTEQYGEDFLTDMRSIFQGEVGQVRDEVNQIRNTNQETAQEKGFMTLDGLLPGWREQNEDPLFKDWLNESDDLSGIRRQDLLQKSFNDGKLTQVVNLFKAFNGNSARPQTNLANEDLTPTNMTEQPAQQRRQMPNTGVNTGDQTEQRIYTKAQVDKFYRDTEMGRFKGQEAAAEATERDIFLAQREGRIRA
jgi:hypothetical protein